MNYVQTPVLKLPFFLHASHGFRQMLIVLLFFGSRLFRVHYDPQQEVQNGTWELTLENRRWM
jgi:hypothetical protein